MTPKQRVPPPPDAAALRAAALRYVARYAAHSGRLRRVLTTRLHKAALLHPDWARDTARLAGLQQEIERIVQGFAEKQYFDDDAFASSKARTMHRQGKSGRAVAAQLRAEGLPPEKIALALTTAQDGQDAAVTELAAARRLAQRKRLGPYRKTTADAMQIRKDYAAFARAGFSSAIARQVLGASLDEDDCG